MLHRNRHGYKGNNALRGENELVQYTYDQVLELSKCMDPITGPIYFIKNYVKIVDLDQGLILFNLWPFQERLIDSLHNNRFTLGKLPRQVGKSTVVTAYFLWYILFNQDKTVAILANKEDIAEELMTRLKRAYINLPKWLQQGVVEWNKLSIRLSNGCKAFGAATSESAIRGQSVSFLFLDEFAHVEPGIAEEFYASVYPTISSGKTTKLAIVSTPNGMNMFFTFWEGATKGRNDFVTVEANWWDKPGRDEEWKKQEIRMLGSEDLFNQEHSCEFIGSSSTLISGSKLKQLQSQWVDPIDKQENDKLWVYEHPIPGHVYTITCDVSRGQGLDAQAFNVIDVTQIPFKQVASFQDNKLSPLMYPNAIWRAAMHYNEAFVLVETNDIGQQVSDILHYELGYDNLIKIMVKGKQGQKISGGFKKVIQYGIRTTTPVKRIGCANLKTLIESDKLILKDFRTIFELMTFVVVKESYAAEEGTTAHDDLAMSLVLFGWLSNEQFFKDSVGSDIRSALIREMEEMLEDDIPHFGIVDDGINHTLETHLEREINKTDYWDVIY
jgi:hypothetical protein